MFDSADHAILRWLLLSASPHGCLSPEFTRGNGFRLVCLLLLFLVNISNEIIIEIVPSLCGSNNYFSDSNLANLKYANDAVPLSECPDKLQMQTM